MKSFKESLTYTKTFKAYHGSQEKITSFDINKSEKWNKFAIWFSDDLELVEMFGKNIYECSLGINNPFTITGKKWDDIRDEHATDDEYFIKWKEELKTNGYDSLIIKYKPTSFGGFTMKAQTIIGIFDNESITSFKQIK